MNDMRYDPSDEMEKTLKKIILQIGDPDEKAMDRARKRQDALAKPPGSLGQLEEISIRLSGITGRLMNEIRERHILVFCADNGVVREGVASAPQSVTLAQTLNLTKGLTGAAVLAHEFGCRMRVCDIGVNAEIKNPTVIDRKVAYGTCNMAEGPAMTREQALRAILSGAELAMESADLGAGALGIGEMGIGNTTTASAVLSVLTGSNPEQVTGRGAGITDEAYLKKISVIRRAIALNQPDPGDAVDTLAKIGGLDIAAMAGAFIGAAAKRIPAVIDGFISSVAAICAVRICSRVRTYLFASHASYEVGAQTAMKELGLVPMLNLGMRLGEGSGCPLAMMLIDAACAVMNRMATFDEARIDDGYLDPIRRIDAFSVHGRGNAS